MDWNSMEQGDDKWFGLFIRIGILWNREMISGLGCL